MPRTSVIAANGRLLARGLYRLPVPDLVDYEDCHDLLPVGAYALAPDLPAGILLDQAAGLYLRQSDLVCKLRRGKWYGCCGPHGSQKCGLDPDTDEPLAYECADCCVCHYLHLASGDYEIVEEDRGNGVCFVGYVSHGGAHQLLAAACGRDEQEAMFRLQPACVARLELEGSYTSGHHQIANLKAHYEEASAFLSRQAGRPKWLFLKY